MPPRNLFAILVSCLVAAVCLTTARKMQRGLLVGDAIHLIDRYYVDPVDNGALLKAAMDGLTSHLDPHSEFIPEELYSAFNDAIQQEFAGVGILVEQPDGGQPVRVISPLVGSPALEAGLLPGDEIVAVDGEDVSQMQLRDVSHRLRGPVGTTVSIEVRRTQAQETMPVRFAVTRRAISLESVVGDHRNGDNHWVFRLRQHPEIAYIRLTSFGEKTESELRRVLSEDLAGGYQSLILDVRGNAGGLLGSAVAICDFFLDSGPIVTIKTRGGRVDSQFDANPGTLVDPAIPVVVLVDGFSASASEIVAACLQDHRRATVVGARSFGKGTVQNVLPMQAGRSALKLTTARYYRPSGANIHRGEQASEDDIWGVTPDEGHAIEMDQEDYARLLRQWQQASFPVHVASTPPPSLTDEPLGDEPATAVDRAQAATDQAQTAAERAQAANKQAVLGPAVDLPLQHAARWLRSGGSGPPASEQSPPATVAEPTAVAEPADAEVPSAEAEPTA